MGNKQCCRNPQQTSGDVVLEPLNFPRLAAASLEKSGPALAPEPRVVLVVDDEDKDEEEEEDEEKESPEKVHWPVDQKELREKFQGEDHKTGEGTHNPQQNGIVQLSQMPTAQNKGIDFINRIKGEFVFNRDLPVDAKFPHLPPYRLERGEVYKGQWKHGQKHGKGIQIWPSNAVYYGYWKDGMANGYGRLVHADGDVYEG